MGDSSQVPGWVAGVALELRSAVLAARAGILRLDRPTALRAAISALRASGPLAVAPVLGAHRYGEHAAIIDERRDYSFGEVNARVDALARHWCAQGVDAGDRVVLMCRNHADLVVATFAAAVVGARAVFLNTDFARPQAEDVCRREGSDVLVYDQEFASVLQGVEAPKGRYLTLDGGDGAGPLDEAIEDGSRHPAPPKPERHGSLVLLTSGTTGTPKGAQREQPKSLSLVGGLLSRIPYRPGHPILVGPPLFHALGLGTALLNFSMGNTLVLQRRFEPARSLDLLEQHRCGSMTVVPVMLNRLLSLGESTIQSRDLSHLKIVLAAGARLEPEVCRRTTEILGDVLYNLYGSTEVSCATIATPADLRVAPGTVGRPVLGVEVKVLEEGTDRPVRTGETGRIFVGSPNVFEGYTGGGSKESLDGLMSTGDVGHLDHNGRLFVEGRDDDMIISGGENVMPGEIEELLITHEAVDQAVVVGIDDDDFGQRLRAVVVLRRQASATEAELQDYVRQNLARFKVPREVMFVDALPRNPTGKILRHQVARL